MIFLISIFNQYLYIALHQHNLHVKPLMGPSARLLKIPKTGFNMFWMLLLKAISSQLQLNLFQCLFVLAFLLSLLLPFWCTSQQCWGTHKLTHPFPSFSSQRLQFMSKGEAVSGAKGNGEIKKIVEQKIECKEDEEERDGRKQPTCLPNGISQ